MTRVLTMGTQNKIINCTRNKRWESFRKSWFSTKVGDEVLDNYQLIHCF